MASQIETDDWQLGCFMEWRAKNHSETCPVCKGKREVGGGLGDLDGPRQCPNCYGVGHIAKGPTTPTPDLPKDLVEHMRRAWWDFNNGKVETNE